MSQSPEKIAAPTVITAHANADFDALAAMIAASRLYPDSVLVFPGSQEKNLRNFYIQSTTYLFNFRNFKDIDVNSVRRLVVVDTRQKSRLAHVQPLLDNPRVEIHAYDHHPDSKEDVVATRSVVKSWGSTTAILAAEMRERGLTPLPEEATVMGLGLFEDTGSFAFDSTTPEDFEAAAWLRRHGMDVNVIADLLSRDLDSEQVKILGELLETATTQEINGVAVVMTEAGTENFVGDFAFLVHKFMDMENIRVLFALGRMGDRIHLVARSRSADVDVGAVCTALGGGGHPYAASATIKNKTLSEVENELFALLYSHVHSQMVVESLMSKPPVVIAQDRPMKDAVELMTRFGLKGVPVVAGGSMECVGLLEHKTADKALTHKLGEVPVREYMLREFLTVPPAAGLQEVMEIILGKRQRLVPVVDQGQLLGVITRTDLVTMLADEPSRIPESLNQERKRERNIRTLMFNRLPADVFDLLKKAGELGQDLGWEVYTVGGFVRDILLARTNLDVDLVVEGDGIRFAREMVRRMGGRAKTHKKFKTAVVILPGGRRVDVATARLEYYEYPAALPTVELSSIKMDLYRRDFTVNALAVHLNPHSLGRLVDFFGAQRDIKEKTIRVIHSLSFVEDPTRILRAVRFEQRFGFRIASQTLRLVKNALQLGLFNKLSGNRVFHELQHILNEDAPLACLSRMQDLGLMEAVHPQLVMDTAKTHLMQEIAKVHNWYKLLYLKPEAAPWKLYLLGLTQGTDAEQARDICCRRLGLSQRDEHGFLALREAIGAALGRLMFWKGEASPLSELYFRLETLPVEGVLFLMARSRREEMRKHISQYLTNPALQSIEISGRDLKRLRIPEGPIYARILKAVRRARIDGQAEGRKEQLLLVRRLKKEWAASGEEPGPRG